MKLLSAFCLLCNCVVVVSSTVSFARGIAGISRRSGPSLFGIPRGGNLFGGKDAQEDGQAALQGEKKMYAALTQKEIEEWLEPIPVYAVLDSNGAGVVLKPENGSPVLFLFLCSLQANRYLQQVKNEKKDHNIKVMKWSLGNVWFKLLNRDGNQEFLQNPEAKDIEYRLVPDPRDLLFARLLLTTSPEDVERIVAGDVTPEMRHAAIEKAMTESPKFNAPYNEIPVFAIPQLRLLEQKDNVDNSELVYILPIYFSFQAMWGVWQQTMAKTPVYSKAVEPDLLILNLHDVVESMQKESETDWRNVMVVPNVPDAIKDVTEAISSMSGATLGDV